jgi:predicted component of type VI protein secretion system
VRDIGLRVSQYDAEKICTALGVKDLDDFTLAEVRDLTKMSPKQLEQFRVERELVADDEELGLDEVDREIAEMEAESQKALSQRSTPAPAPTPAAAQQKQQQAAPALGWGTDGLYRVTDAQLRDPAWCAATQADRVKAGANIRIVS